MTFNKVDNLLHSIPKLRNVALENSRVKREILSHKLSNIDIFFETLAVPIISNLHKINLLLSKACNIIRASTRFCVSSINQSRFSHHLGKHFVTMNQHCSWLWRGHFNRFPYHNNILFKWGWFDNMLNIFFNLNKWMWLSKKISYLTWSTTYEEMRWVCMSLITFLCDYGGVHFLKSIGMHVHILPFSCEIFLMDT